MAFDVFISYGHQDKLVADATCARLEERGIRCWIAPRDLLPGQSWAEGVADALRNCLAFVLVFSDHANSSKHVPNEVERAVHHGLPIVPLRIQDVKPGPALEIFIGPVHWLDALTPPLDQYLERLAGSVQRLIGEDERTPRVANTTPAPLQPRNLTLSRYGVAAAIIVGVLVLSATVAYVSLTRARNAPVAPHEPAPIVGATPVPESAAQAKPTAAIPKPPPARGSDMRESALARSSRTSRRTESQPPPLESGSAQQPPAPAVAAASRSDAPTGIIGCWLYNGLSFRMYEDGRFTGFLGGRWSDAGPNRYVLTFPPSTDTLVLASDGKTVRGTNNYGGSGVSGQRTSGDPKGLVGSWQWSNGQATTISVDGTASNGGVSGKWTSVAADTYRIVWNYVFVDQLVMSADGRNLSGRNQLNMTVGGIRIPCVD